MQGTPATWQLLLSAGWNGDDDMTILCGGEALTGDLGRALLTKCASLWNMYGPTETTIWSAVSKVTNCADSTIPIGPPIANTSFYVLDQGRNVVPIGAAGELYIGGEGVALGYLNRPDLTGERFVPNPFNSADGDRLYRTGDLVRLRRDGQIEFLGRSDHQIKLRGFRIELGEIESCLRAQPGVKDAVVLLRQDPSNPHLAAYVAVDGAGNAPTQPDLSDALRLSLPQYMIPPSIVIMNEFPRTPNGKLDRSALPVAGQPTSMAEFVEPRTEEEQTISEVFSTLLNLEKISTRDNFFDIGAHSLLIAKAHDTLKKRLDPDLQIISFFQHPTIESLARSISDRRDQPVPMGTRKVEVQ
jgi:acyl-CoA synthetase (AMP-forming)/AMP-acid ligase II